MTEVQLELQSKTNLSVLSRSEGSAKRRQTGKKRTLIYVSADNCEISRFNTRKRRDEEHIDLLAARIERNGFELTRALWAYQADEGKEHDYEVFAGGDRLLAVRKTSHRDSVPLLLHEGFTNQEIAQLETQDNQNDEYHREVPIVDIWAEYARLRDEEGWTQQKIADAKGVSRSVVAHRLRYEDRLPKQIKEFVSQGEITEAHLREIMQLCLETQFDEWIRTEQLWIRVAKWAKYRTVSETKEEIDRWKEIIKTVRDYYEKLPTDDVQRAYKDHNGKKICTENRCYPQKDFAIRLATEQPDTKRKVQNIINRIKKEQLEASKKYEAFLKKQADEAEADRQKKEEEERNRQEREFFYPKLFCQSSEDMEGELLDIDDAVHTIPDESVALVVTSPPYNIGKEYENYDDKQSWDSYKQELLKPVFQQCYKKLMNGGRIAVNVPNGACQEGSAPVFILFDLLSILRDCGFKDREIVTWIKADIGENFHSRMDALAFDMTAWGSWLSPSNPVMRRLSEFIIVMHKGTPKLEGETESDLTEDEFKLWTRDVWFIPPASCSKHPTVFPEELPERVIKLYSYRRQIVLDPFMGIGTTGIAAIRNQRRFIGFDISEKYCREAINAITRLDIFTEKED